MKRIMAAMLAGILAGAANTGTALAEDSNDEFKRLTGTALAEDEPDFLSLGTGWYDFNDDRDAVDFRVEYRSDLKLLGFVKPWAGFEFTSDGAAYGVAGVLADIFFGRRRAAHRRRNRARPGGRWLARRGAL